jgi:hypothetical protein
MRVLLDTNILVRLRDADSPLHSLCVEAIERLINQMAQICLCLKVLIPIVRPKFIICPPPLGSPRFARGTARGAPVRFPLLAGGTLRRGFSFIRTFVNSGSTIGIIEFWSVSTRPREANGMGLFLPLTRCLDD